MLGALTEQMTKLFHELMEELRGIRTELAALREAVENANHHPALRPAAKRASSGRK